MKKPLLLLSVFLLISIFSPVVHGEIQNMVTELYTTKHGLSSTKITSITQDDKGFIWIGTEDGLNKFDGYNFTVYKQGKDSTSLVSDHIATLYKDSRQRLWVATIDGLHYYNPESDNFRRVALHQPDYIVKDNQCISILEDRTGSLWFASSGLGVLRYWPDEERSTFYSPSHTQPNSTLCSGYIRCMIEDQEGHIWFGSQDRGLSMYDPDTQTFRNYNTSNSRLSNNAVFGLELLGNGNIVVSTIGGGVNIFDRITREFVSYPTLFDSLPTRYVYCTLQDANGHLLVGTDGNGVMIFDPEHLTLRQHPVYREQMQEIGDTKVHCLFEDNHGYIWVGMNYKGLCVIKNEPSGFACYRRISNDPHSLSYGHVMGITTDRDRNIWIATDGGGLNRYNRETGEYTYYKYQADNPHSISDNAVVSVFCDSKDQVWAGTYMGGLCLLTNPKKGTFLRYQATGKEDGLSSNFVKHIVEDRDGYLWIATNGGGLNRFDPKTRTFRCYRHETQPGLVNDYLNRLFIDSKQRLWIASYFGLSRMDLETETFIAFGTEHGLSSPSVYSLAEDEEGTVWIGTQNGLHKYDPVQNRFALVTPPTPGVSPVINGLGTYKDQLWMSTNNGIVQYIPRTGLVKRYNMNHGLQNNEFILSSYYQSPEGEIFFGGIDGFNSFFPEEIHSKAVTPPVYITDLKIFNQSVPIHKAFNGRVILDQSIAHSQKIKLRHSDKSFTLEFTAPDTPDPSATLYACRLEGFNRDWIHYDHTRRYATYTNLDPGTYIFRVKASNDPEVWGVSETTLVIEIEPPLWATWWARTGYVLLAFAILALILRFVFIRIREKNELRIERMKVKQQEELSQAKMQFFTNISHEFRSPLTLIIGPLESMLAAETDLEKKQTEQMMLRNAQRLLRLINQILELRKAEQGKMKLRVQNLELVTFISRALGAFSEWATRKQISLTYTWDPDYIQAWYDPDLLDQCLYNILSNAFKYTPEVGKIQVSLSVGDDGKIHLCITDSGIGMSAEAVQRVFERFYQADNQRGTTGTGIGMHLTKSIVELHRGDITVQSEEGKGTTFCLTILPGKAHFSPEDFSDTSYTPEDMKEKDRSLPTSPAIPLDAGSSDKFVPSATPADTPSMDSPVSSEETQQTKPSSRTTTLLLVEDDDDMRRYIRQELEGLYRIEEANNGKTGLAKAHKLMPDLVITDVMMPEMSGTELCRALKTDAETCHIPVIILTAQGDMAHRIEGLETGADSYIPKPFHTQHLKIRVEKLIELRRSMKERFSKSLNMEAQEVTLTSTDERLLQNVIDYIRTNLENPELTVEVMSKDLGMSRTHLHRKLKALTGQSPVEFIKVIRMKQAAYLLSTGKLTVSEVGYKVGYSTPSYFSSSFNAHFGMSPTAYMEKNKQAE